MEDRRRDISGREERSQPAGKIRMVASATTCTYLTHEALDLCLPLYLPVCPCLPILLPASLQSCLPLCLQRVSLLLKNALRLLNNNYWLHRHRGRDYIITDKDNKEF